jgi:intracellular sulfur oxidation DsrE/DsrF family protein
MWKSTDWHLASFQALLAEEGRVKQVFESTQIADGVILTRVKNSLNGLHSGFGIPEQAIKSVVSLCGSAIMLTLDDFFWAEHKVGEWLHIADPSTGAPAQRNVFYGIKDSLHECCAGKGAHNDALHLDSICQSADIHSLQARGVKFLCCHTAMEEQAQLLALRSGASQTAEQIEKEMLAHVVPGVLVVASGAAAVALLQSDGDYRYMHV